VNDILQVTEPRSNDVLFMEIQGILSEALP